MPLWRYRWIRPPERQLKSDNFPESHRSMKVLSKTKLILLSASAGTILLLVAFFRDRENVATIKGSLGERLVAPKSTFNRNSNIDLLFLIDDSLEWSRTRQSSEFDSCKAAALISSYNNACLQAQANYEHQRKELLDSAWNPASLFNILGLGGLKLDKFFADHPNSSIFDVTRASNVISKKIDEASSRLIPSFTYKAVMTDINGQKSVHQILERSCYHPSISKILQDSSIEDRFKIQPGSQISFPSNIDQQPGDQAIEALHYEVCLSQGLKYLPHYELIQPRKALNMRSIMNLGHLKEAQQILKQEQELKEREELQKRLELREQRRRKLPPDPFTGSRGQNRTISLPKDYWSF
jgi:hypothetical protein